MRKHADVGPGYGIQSEADVAIVVQLEDSNCRWPCKRNGEKPSRWINRDVNGAMRKWDLDLCQCGATHRIHAKDFHEVRVACAPAWSAIAAYDVEEWKEGVRNCKLDGKADVDGRALPGVCVGTLQAENVQLSGNRRKYECLSRCHGTMRNLRKTIRAGHCRRGRRVTCPVLR
ncbi:hypothetical protein CBM2626_U10010 [Cupriavidus taiwanensis]|uniref:Uncharacterized protein n=1 Tax=Cupriavidus taiwanensis TaxID=164546 RepID=A0A375FKG1_9BURK|nr:hypothetical protein CBM2613_U20011 [Cupriavidus taiwanensis]SPA03749.1 hypothetical protein CBM2626_U10010 [Cupriavidus taiwanensis]SPA12571.1 hypothetical protein CBM2625_U10014 [Cupriavidus taiwanensis]SPA57710.1 hypothetical protein CBM2638_U30009 [Cupriavidus taiwanensis]SPD49001.1 protein of unknown function [Cupriavidus taiwanensis]